MSGPPTDPSGSTEPQLPADPTPSGRSRYEDFDLSDVSASPAARKRRTPTIAVAALVLAISGALPLITVAAFRPGGIAGPGLLALGVAELIGAGLVFALHPLGRPIGLVLGAIGVVLGIVSATSVPVNGLITIALNGFVIYALASSGPAFRRE